MFKIYYINYQTINETQCKWDNLPDIPIIQIDYNINKNKIVRIKGFESYIIFKEYYAILLKKFKKLSTINILAKSDKFVYQFSLNVPKRKALQRKGIWGKEFCSLKYNSFSQKFEFGKAQKTNHSLWKRGISTSFPRVEII